MRCYCCDREGSLTSFTQNTSYKHGPVRYHDKFKEYLCAECITVIYTGKTRKERAEEDFIVYLPEISDYTQYKGQTELGEHETSNSSTSESSKRESSEV